MSKCWRISPEFGSQKLLQISASQVLAIRRFRKIAKVNRDVIKKVCKNLNSVIEDEEVEDMENEPHEGFWTIGFTEHFEQR